ncbi:Zn(II)2Cys6 transcription factor domain-containing protein [Aspergillus stella-maris]|uniref:Zn(II)2Cys6 transcription factor domain-containing protein n=1 Tax=Aspergillus stella-maris TaxID=1810926 RepID=UPI003CCCA99C
MPARTQSRITTACNSCRMRKQKCSGNRPKCIQCLDHRRTCDWPEQLKRGPAKGYIESLERRLQETESLLLGLLEQVSDTQLAEGISNSHASVQLRSAAATPNAKRGSTSTSGSEHWRLFPLRSVSEVRAWQEECMRPTGGLPGSASDSARASISTPTAERYYNAATAEPVQPTEPENINDPQPLAMQDPREREQRPQPQRTPGPEPQPSVSTWSGAPSADFQQRFLW